MAGRKRTPDQLKVVAGTDRPDRSNPDAPIASAGVAVAPEWLSVRAAEIFGQVSATLDGMGIASPDDQLALSLLASRIEEVELMTAALEDGGRTYEQKDDEGNVRMRRAAPEAALRNEAMRHAQSLLAEFGLTPSARSKVSAGKPVMQNPFAALE